MEAGSVVNQSGDGASAATADDDGGKGKGKGKHMSFGLEKTKLDNQAKIMQQKLTDCKD